LLVVEEGRTLRGDVKSAEKLLTATHLIGTVLNKSSELRIPAEEASRRWRGLFRRAGD